MTENTVIKTPPISSNEDYEVTLHEEFCHYLTECKNIYSCYSSIKYDKCKDCPYTKQIKYNLI